MNHETSSVNKRENPCRRSTSLKTIAQAATFAVLFWSIQANAYPLHNGEYLFWPQMPAAAQVLTDMKGKNDLDTAARQHAAFVLLIALVNVAADGTGQIPWPAREQELNGAYDHALPDWNGHRDEIMAESLQLQADPSFVQPFLKRYFTEAALDEIKPMISSLEASAQKHVSEERKTEEAYAQKETEESKELAQINAAELQSKKQDEKAARLGMTPSELESFNTYVRTYLALCAIFSILWIFRILRALKPIRMTSDFPPRFEGPWKSWRIYSFTGYIRGSVTRSITSVSGSISTVGNTVQGGISSSTTVIDTYRLVDPRNQQEQNFRLRNSDVQLWENQLVSVVRAIRKHQENGDYFILVNHTTGEQFIRNDVVYDIVKLHSLFWTLSFFICILIPPVWLLAIIWGILIENKTKRFMKSGIQPLVETLNQRAKKLS
ncbi:MAG TPA: hypothetical protein VIK53_13615 [Verrucomicrobiae bacterium]